MNNVPPKQSMSNEEVYSGFQVLRSEQRILANKLTEMEAELNEHKVVVDTLKIVDPHRKCYRMVGGILCERTVQEIMPVLLGNKDQLMNVIKSLKEQLSKKGSEINDYKKKYKIRIKMQDYKQKQENFTESKRNAVVVL
ncbi:prefoldin subunit 2 isoform X2 [Phymastichus coffea]|uniref:prefoldin subunit 2 isoform X2 n=1 Tax=Phymastichus coffea TaxID=108790 RepID=UPI00273C196C|nr:prefoldin subunit 2 isoform X2 [Phymastichus coffea]XP_058800591.1 prefoldin subunit 2 isoform X2 [Phymastichus coffea]XP_058800599.1 prefoldin subunit 2 isoform X2 [Phymastichus coffea]